MAGEASHKWTHGGRNVNELEGCGSKPMITRGRLFSMHISNFIRDHIQPILLEWDRVVGGLPAAAPLSVAALRDHAEEILLTIAADLERARTASQEERTSPDQGPAPSGNSSAGQHGSERVIEGFSVSDVMSEYRFLRASVARLWAREQAVASQSPDCADLIRFNEAVDQALTESLTEYSDAKERRSRLYDTLLSVSPDLSFIVNTEGQLIYGNPALASEFGESLSILKGKRLTDTNGHSYEQFEEHVRLVARSKSTALGEISRKRRGECVTYEYLLVPVLDDKQEIEAVAGIARDVTTRKAVEDKYKRSAQYDDLTGLPNRHLFRDRLHHEMKRADRIHLPLALMFVDLDGFKQVNDLLGHAVGDELLREAAARIRLCVRETDTVARLGGDEFTVILTEIRDMPHVKILAQHILDELARAFFLAGRKVSVSASIGVALYPNDAVAQDELLRHADQAMYAAKQSGRNRYSFFTAQMRNSAWVHLKRIGELRQAVTEHQLKVLYQPIVDLSGTLVVGAEAQLIWQHPENGQLPAHAFADLAAEAGLVGEIDELVLKDALARADEWRMLLGFPVHVSIEKASFQLSGKASDQQNKSIVAQISRAQAPVALEISESMLLADAAASTKLLQQLSSSGVPLCLDDFGTGTSSLASLARFPLAGLRLAPQLVHEIEEDVPRALASGIIATGHSLGLKIVAEGVDTMQQQARLLEIGCDYGQGARFFGAMDAGALKKLLARTPG